MKTFTPIRGMIICSSGGEYVHISDYEILQQQIEDIKCCGNCVRAKSDYYDECYTFIAENPKAFKAVCHKWKSDGLTAKEREI